MHQGVQRPHYTHTAASGSGNSGMQTIPQSINPGGSEGGEEEAIRPTRDVPDSDGLVERGRGHQVLRGMELGTHHIVVVPRQNTAEELQHRAK